MRQPRSYERTPYGYLSFDHAAFIERGARMSDGGTAWLIWYRTVGEKIVDVPTPYLEENGQIVRTLADLTGPRSFHAHDDIPGFYVHRNDAGSLAEAKQTVESVLAR